MKDWIEVRDMNNYKATAKIIYVILEVEEEKGWRSRWRIESEGMVVEGGD